MAFAFLNEDNLYTRYEAAKTHTERLSFPFPEFERIARNKPSSSIDPAYPKTTDGTTASIIRKTPRRIIQQLPTGTVISEDNGWLGIVAEYIFTERIIPHANDEYALIQKCWNIIEKGLTFGYGASYTPFLNHDGEFTPDLTLPYWGDLFIQPGKKSGYSSSYVFMRAWWQKEDIEALIDKETKLKASADKRKETYDSSWDLDALKDILEAESHKDSKASTPSEEERGTGLDGIELITGFQKGIGAKFYTFNPVVKKIVRTKVNKDPRGKMPVDFMYGDIDGSNPLGRGLVELIGGLQNLIDSDMQMYQFNRALMLAPPVIKRGNFSKNKIVYQPNHIIDVGDDAQAAVEPLKIDSTAVANYPALYGLQKSQLLNLVNSPDTSISSDIGNPSFSKTTAGVNQQQAIVSVDDNYIGKMFETWFEAWAETAINLYFAERSGVEELQLDKETAARLRELPNFDVNMISPDNKIRIDYDTATEALKFRVNPSTTKKKSEAEQVANATQLLDIVMKYPMLNSNFGGTIDVDVLSRRIVINSGIDDPEEISPEPTEQQKEAKAAAKQQVSPFSPMYDKPSIRIDYGDVEDPQSRAKLLELAGAAPAAPLNPLSPRVAESAARGVGAIEPQEGAGQAQPAEAPIDLGDIYKQTTDPQVKAEIEQMAGLHPNQAHVQNQVDTNDAQHLSDQVSSLSNVAQAVSPDQPTQNPSQDPAQQEDAQEPQPDTDPELTPLDHQIIAHLQALKIPNELIVKAIQMLEAGANEQQVLEAIGVKHG